MAQDGRFRGTLEGHALWAFKEFCRLTGKSQSGAMSFIIERWALLDEEYAHKHGLTLRDYQGGDVVEIQAARRAKSTES